MKEKGDIAEALSGKKLEIVNASYELFHEKGYYATSMRDISEAVGLTKASLCHHYGSKEELMEGVLHCIQRFLRLEIFCIAYHEHLTPKQRSAEYIKQTTGCILDEQEIVFHR